MTGKKIFRLFHSHISSISPFSSFYRRKERFFYPLYTSTGADYWLLNQWNPYPFWGQPPPIGHDREYPPGIHDKLSHTKNTPFYFYVFFSPRRQTVLHFIFKFLSKRFNIINRQVLLFACLWILNILTKNIDYYVSTSACCTKQHNKIGLILLQQWLIRPIISFYGKCMVISTYFPASVRQ